MQKVKVTRYVSGRRPEYAPEDSSGESSEEEEGFGEGVREGETGEGVKVEVREEDWRDDPRLRRLRERRMMGDSGRYYVCTYGLLCVLVCHIENVFMVAAARRSIP